MLSLRLHLADLQAPRWRPQAGRWVNGESWIEPANLGALVTELDDDRAPFVRVKVKEGKRGEADFTELTMTPDEVRLTVGVFGSAPLHLVAKAGVLHASWDLAELRPYLRPERLVPRVVARTLTRQHRYTSETLFEGVYRLTERATAVFTSSGLAIRYPEPAEHVLEPRPLRSGVDPLTVFDELLTNVVREAPTATGCVGVELSGGADSGNVALAVRAARFDETYSFGLLVGGALGAQQRERRQVLVDHCGFRDTAIPAMQYPPFAPGGVRALGKPHDPAGAFYREAFDVVREQAANRRCEVMVTGSGGDEINAHHSRKEAELPPAEPVPWLGSKATQALGEVNENLAPMPVLPVPTLMAFGLHNPGFLRSGTWPVSPLVHPHMVRFMEQLPHEHKRGKALFRDRIRRAGLPEWVAAPTEPENFLGVLESGLRSYGAPILGDMLRKSVLVDLQPGMVDFAHQVRPALDIRAGDMRTVRLGRRTDVVTCLGNSLAYVHDNDEISEVFETFAAHARPGGLLVLCSPVSPITRSEVTTTVVRTPHGPAQVTITYSWDLRTQINTMHRSWVLPTGDEARDEIRRRVLFPRELDRYVSGAGFEVVDMVDEVSTGLTGPIAYTAARYTRG
ncbi:asparagine synthase [Streptomyces sp. P17]|uniref:asparagine synthase n=1 Tax=Streptomyces sp. P17 TaxID=3074716 RepID=UPI0028F43A8D|nr:asparagine synthase [Streptomyces sp. P17]MDT9697088.1 asparagine synthase [Streptomyces sp. P17]